jgi:flagellar M-ring protein FliF
VRQAPNTHRENIINYEVDKTVRHTKVEVGTVKRLSAAVVVNYRREADKERKGAYKPLSEVELAQIDTLTRDAMGFSKERGDTLNIVNAPFSAESVPSAAPAPNAWDAWVDDVASPAGLRKAATYLVPAALIAFLLFGLVLPVARNLKRAGQMALAGSSVSAPAPPSATGYAPAREANFEADLKAVRDLASQQPHIVANVVKDWVGRDE